MELISREQAIDAITDELDKIDHVPQWVFDKLERAIKQLPPIHPVNNSEMPNSSDVISRQKAIDALRKLREEDIEDYGCEIPEGFNQDHLDRATFAIKQLPPIQPKRGRWISADAIFGGVPFYCSECGENTRDTVMGKPRWNFCPNCGADMREVTT
jgi:hypothetical protein